ncbi:MAG TPA: hypothetical protein VK742_00010 [Candidatus Sulfotelmatobacter sp.]|jgi:hypothetical protein|nr:hypothetical protein [Candidatus Sulfotelmatobacter sp.]
MVALLLLGAVGARAETDVWFDGFETDAGASWTTNTVWKVGSPTTGPAANAKGYRAYDGTQCATTGLKANAPAGAEARLICTNYNGQPYLTIPDATLYPRLRFWQWFSFLNALGYVEVLPQGSTNWQTVSATNMSVGGTSSIGGGWTRPSIDLSGFAGTNLQVAFHFLSGANVGNDLGWYLDDVALVTGTPVFNNPESFEGGLGDWAVDNGVWQVGTPTRGPNAAHSGTNCASTGLTGYYPWNADTRLISPQFTIPPSNSPALHFWQWYKFLNALGFVEISSSQVQTNFSYTTAYLTATNIDVDTNIIYITNLDFPFGYTQTNIVTLTNFDTDTFIYTVTNTSPTYLQTNTQVYTNINTGTNVFVDTNTLIPVYSLTNVYIFTNLNQFAAFVTTNGSLVTSEWQTISRTNISVGSSAVSSPGWVGSSLDLSAFAGQTVQVAFHFQSGGNGLGNAVGWYVDDVSMVTSPVLTVPADQTILAGQTFTALATATNSLAPDATYAFSFAAHSTNAFITTNGVINWTNTSPAFGTNLFSVVATDTNSPPVLVTNSFTVTVLPAYSFSISNPPAGKKSFILALHSRTNLTWQIDASTDLVDWLPVWTNSTSKSGTLLFTDLLATNFPERFYRAVYP